MGTRPVETIHRAIVPDEFVVFLLKGLNMRTPKDVILEIVNERQGDKGTVIAAACAKRFIKEQMKVEDFPALLDELVQAKQLLEVEYRLPPHCGQNLSYKVKSFYLPSNSQVAFKGVKRK